MPTKMSHGERVLLGRIGAYTLHSRYDSRELIEPARRAFWSKFERDVDPEGVLEPEERARRADMARKAHFAKLALLSAQACRKKAARKRS
jgi:hypothetical protein